MVDVRSEGRDECRTWTDTMRLPISRENQGEVLTEWVADLKEAMVKGS
jgi:hypothetical protein